MRSPIRRRRNTDGGKSTMRLLIPPCFPVTVPTAPTAGPEITHARFPTHEYSSSARLAAPDWPRDAPALLRTEAPGSTWSPGKPTAGSPTLRFSAMPPVPGTIRGTPSRPIRYGLPRTRALATCPATASATRDDALVRGAPVPSTARCLCVAPLEEWTVPVIRLDLVPEDVSMGPEIGHSGLGQCGRASDHCIAGEQNVNSDERPSDPGHRAGSGLSDEFRQSVGLEQAAVGRA